MKKAPIIDHGMYQDVIDYLALIKFQASLSPLQMTSSSNNHGNALKVKKSRRSKGRKTSKRNFPKKMLKR